MSLITLGLAAAFAVMVGRNDGAPLLALALRALHQRPWWPLTALVIAIIGVPLAGFDAVAETLEELLRHAARGTTTGLPVLLAATIGTLALSSAVGIPTSITLALVGASAGAQFAAGQFDLAPVLRVLGLAALGPVVACLLALVVTQILSATHGRRLDRLIRLHQAAAFVVNALAYGANDAQKVLAVFAVALSVTVPSGARFAWLAIAISLCFVAGALLGLRASSRRLRQGVLHPRAYQVATTLWSSSVAVLIGAALAAPMSMTQAVTGALVGSTPPGQWRRVRWDQSRKICLAWAWTLPAAGFLAWAIALAVSAAG